MDFKCVVVVVVVAGAVVVLVSVSVTLAERLLPAWLLLLLVLVLCLVVYMCCCCVVRCISTFALTVHGAGGVINTSTARQLSPPLGAMEAAIVAATLVSSSGGIRRYHFALQGSVHGLGSVP